MEDSKIVADVDCPEMTEEQFKIMSLVLSHDGTRGGSRKAFYYQGMETERLASIRNIMKTMRFTLRQAMEALEIPLSEYDKYAEVI